MLIKEITAKIEPVLKKYDVSFAGLFGSWARGEEKENSDLDLLVRFNTPKSLLDLVGLENDLSDTLNIKVDVVTEGALSPLIKPSVFQNLQVLYGQR